MGRCWMRVYQESSKNAKIDKILVPKPGLGTIEVVPVEVSYKKIYLNN
ncbi:8557_t:CDS:2 [Entrophospora sp. SA101]|nr:8557_t:CDS:2 [Entrophospora sp. SA101]